MTLARPTFFSFDSPCSDLKSIFSVQPTLTLPDLECGAFPPLHRIRRRMAAGLRIIVGESTFSQSPRPSCEVLFATAFSHAMMGSGFLPPKARARHGADDDSFNPVPGRRRRAHRHQYSPGSGTNWAEPLVRLSRAPRARGPRGLVSGQRLFGPVAHRRRSGGDRSRHGALFCSRP